MRNKFLGKGAFLLISVVAGNTFAGGSANALWTKEESPEEAMSVVDMVCSNLFGFKEIEELKKIAEPLTEARRKMMNKFKNEQYDDFFNLSREYDELLKKYGGAEEALDAARGECINRIFGKGYQELDAESEERVFYGIVSQNRESKAEKVSSQV